MTDIVLVTGANRGLGKKVCEMLASMGAQVILTSRNREEGNWVAREIQAKGQQCFFCHLNLKVEASFQEAFRLVRAEFGRIDVLINNAAIHYDVTNSVIDPDFPMVAETFETNLLNTWKLTTVMLPLLRQSEHGRIVNVSSSAGALHQMGGGTPAYSMTKAGLNVLTIKLAAVLRGEILVNSVCPGWVRTDMGGPHAPRSLVKGAASIIWAAQLEKGGPTGGFFRDGQPIPW